MTRRGRFIGPIIWTLLFAAGLTTLLVLDATAREVAGDAATFVFGLVTTPFIFEATLALLFLAALLTYNRWRNHKEGDGWVYLVSEEPDEDELPGAVSPRHHSMLLAQKPEPLDLAGAERGVIEGYLELGMPSQALAELNSRPSPHISPESVALRIRVLSANLDTEAAVVLLRQSTAANPEVRTMFATASLESARWILKHLQRHDLARLWLREARRLDPAVLDGLEAREPLRRLA